MACESAGRAARLLELEPRYCDVIVARWESHWELHRGGQTALFCSSTTVDEDQRPAVPDLEEEASRFAAALLMPRWLMVRQHAHLGDDLDRMCRAFRTSGVAMARRMEDVFRAP